MKFIIFTAPVRLNTFDFSIKEAFYMSLKKKKNALDLRSIMQKINPCESSEVINKANIIFKARDRNWSRPPDIRMNKFKWFRSTMNRIIVG